MTEYVEVDGQDIERYTYLQNDDGQARCSIDIQGEAIWTGKTKALIIIMPHYKGDIPTVINVGLEQKEIGQAIDLADGAFFTDTYKRQIKELENELARYRGY